MMSALFLVVTILAGLYMSWSIGANDVANAMGTSVGSRAITLKQAVILAAIFDFTGAILVGSHVTATLQKGIVDPEIFLGKPEVFAAGMLAALIGAAAWVHIATAYGLPVSTSHSIVGAIFAFGLVYGGFSSVQWGKMLSIVISWVISPLAGALLGFLMFGYLHQRIFQSPTPAMIARRVAPQMVFLVVAIVFLSVIFKGPKTLHLDLPLGPAAAMAAGIGLIVAGLYALLLRRHWIECANLPIHQQLDRVEQIFRYLQIATACYVAFAHGANDVANAMGPVAGIYMVMKTNNLDTAVQVPIWILAIGAVGIALGISTYGYRVIKTIGEKITEMTPTRGFAAQFSCATTVLTCSLLGLPVSTSHTIVGSVVGVGLARGISTIDRKIVMNICYSWVITIPVAAIITIVLLPILEKLF